MAPTCLPGPGIFEKTLQGFLGLLGQGLVFCSVPLKEALQCFLGFLVILGFLGQGIAQGLFE